MAKFKNLNVEFRDVMSLSIRDRIDMLSSSYGQEILQGFTPAQLVDLFPRYYSERLPNVGKNLSGVMKSVGTITTPANGAPTPASRPAPTTTPAPTTGAPVQGQVGTTAAPPSVTGTRARPSTSTPSAPVIPDWQKKLQEKTGVTIAGQVGVAKEGTDVLKGQAQTQKSVYDAFTKAGFSHKQSIALTAEVGRENNYNPEHIFGVHKEPGGGAGVRGRPNQGMLSFGHPARRKAFMDHMRNEGMMDENGNIPRTKEALEAQARFIRSEMGRYNKSSQAFLNNTEPTEEQSRKLLASYIGWDIAGKYIDAPSHIQRMSKYYRQIENITSQPNFQTEPTQRTPVPQGLDSAFLKEYERLNPEQKERVNIAIGKLGNGDSALGVGKFNEMYRSSPNITTQQVTGSLPQGEIPTTSRVDEKHIKTAGTRRLPIKAELKDYLDFAMQKHGIAGFETTSGGQARLGTGGPRKGSTRHDEGNAVDGRFFVLDDKGKRQYLPYTDSRVKNSVRELAAVIPGAGIGANYMGGRTIDPTILHIGGPDKPGGPAIHYTGARGSRLGNKANELDPYFDQGRDPEYRRQAQSEFQQFKTRREEQIANARKNNQAIPESRVTEASTEEKQRLYEQQIQSSPFRIASRENPSQIPGTEVTQTPNREGSKPVQVAPPPAPPAPSPASPTSVNPTNTSEGSKKPTVDGFDAEAFALGGETKAQGPLTAYKINKQLQRSDDLLVTDGQKQFTMNSTKESMKYNPDTGKVEVDHARGETRQRTNPNQLGPEYKPDVIPETQPNQIQENNASQMNSQPAPQIPQVSSFDTTTSLVDDIFKSASFKRAVASSRFMKDSDPLGGHYDQGAYNIT